MQCIPLELHVLRIFRYLMHPNASNFLSAVIHLITKIVTVMWFSRKDCSQWIAERLEDLSQSSAFRGMVSIVFLQQNSRSNFESSTQTSRQSFQGEKLSWTNSNFSATSDDGDTYRRYAICCVSTAFNQWISLILRQQSECDYRPTAMSDGFWVSALPTSWRTDIKSDYILLFI